MPLTDKEVGEIVTLARLRQVVSFQGLRKAAAYLRAQGFNPFSASADTFAVVARGALVKLIDGKKAVLLLGKCRGQLLLPFSFRDLRRQTPRG
jgi:hypothetical protein